MQLDKMQLKLKTIWLWHWNRY